MPDPIDDPIKALKRLRELWDEPTPNQKSQLPNQVSGKFPGVNGDITLTTPRPPQFQPAPEVRGDSDIQIAMDQLLKIAPNLQGMIRKVQMGPTSSVMNQLDANNELVKKQGHGQIFKAVDFPSTNLLGVTDMKTGDISLNPRIRNEEHQYNLLGTLGHEVTHAAGYWDENRPEEAARLTDYPGLINQLKNVKIGK